VNNDNKDYSVLVVHPRSLHRFSFKGVTMVAMDEVTSLLRQIGSWGTPDTETTKYQRVYGHNEEAHDTGRLVTAVLCSVY
jgi:hypothetical protein